MKPRLISEVPNIIEYNPSYNNKFWISFFEILENCNHKFNELNGRLYLISSQGITSIEKGETIPFDASLIVYSEVTALNNAYRYDEKDGIIFYFHTDENNHLWKHTFSRDLSLSIFSPFGIFFFPALPFFEHDKNKIIVHQQQSFN